MTRNKRIQEDSKKREDYFPNFANDIITKKDQTPGKVEVHTNENPMANKEGEKEVLIPPHGSVPFPQRLKDKSKDGQFSRFFEMLKRVDNNIPFTQAITQMPKYDKYLKEILSNKEKLTDFATIGLNKECYVIVFKEVAT